MNILHLEMSRFFSRVIEKVARSEGHEYYNEATLEAGLAALETHDIDLVISAHVLKDGRAEKFLRSLDDTGRPDLPVIVITADDTLADRERFFALGVMDYLLKSEIVPQKLAQYFQVLDRENALLKSLAQMKVAVLDDSNVSLHVVRSIFHFYGITQASYFNSPRAMLKTGPFDLYIIDLVLPQMSGDEVIVEVRKRDPQGAIIAVSGIANRLTAAHTLALGANDYITKPFDARDFMARVKSAVRSLVLIRELDQRRREMEELARKDSLTMLWNHGAIHGLLDDLLEHQKGRSLAVLLLDLDNFKSINDRFGHQSGDLVIKAAARILESASKDLGEAGRYGGEEFIVVLPDVTEDRARSMGERILQDLRTQEYDVQGLRATGSIGMAYCESCENPTEIVERADEALYRAKAAGKDRLES